MTSSDEGAAARLHLASADRGCANPTMAINNLRVPLSTFGFDRSQDYTMAKTLYMVIEHFKGGDAVPVYRRFRDHGRLAPHGLTYVSSWVDTQLERCYQLMEADDPQLLDEWIAHWNDLVDFEVHAVITSAEAVERLSPRLRPDDE